MVQHRRRRKKRKNKRNPWLLPLSAVLGAVVLLCLLLSSAEPSEMLPLGKITLPKRNDYDTNAFYTEDGFLRYAGKAHMVGIDVSVHQGIIDWDTVAESGAEFVILRAGYRGSTVGDLYEDEQFSYNISEAKRVGLQVGVYFFSQALNAQEALEEAQYVCQLLNDCDLELPVFYDWEFIGGRVESEASVPMTDCALAFCEEIERQGYRAGVYFNQNYGYHYLNLKRLEAYTLWLAEYDESPDFAYHFDCLQYSDSGTVDGIEGNVDLDIYFLEDTN